jgi:cellobiose-specific phosphotransferase system component IIB
MANVKNIVHVNKLTDNQMSWANSEAAGTLKQIDVALRSPQYENYALTVDNPSAETALTVNIYNRKDDLNGVDTYSLITTLSISMNSTETKLIDKVLLNPNVRIELSNDTAIGLSGAFTATVRVEEIGIGG